MVGLLKHLGTRFLWAIFVIVGITLMTFIITHMIPTDPALAAAGPSAHASQVAEIREAMGLDQPLPVQYVRYISGLVRGDWGIDFQNGRPITEEIGQRLAATVELIVASVFLSTVIGIPLGILAALRRNTWVDRTIQMVSVGGMALPQFWFGLILQIVFFQSLHWLPSSGRFGLLQTPPAHVTGLYTLDALFALNWTDVASALVHLVLPAFTLCISLLANVVRITRESVVNVLRTDYIRTARAKGLTNAAIVYRHVLKNAAIPIVTIVGLNLGWLFSGTVVVEQVFGWPGIGRYAIDAIAYVDFNALMGVTVVSALLFLVVNLIVDLSYALLDPRISYS